MITYSQYEQTAIKVALTAIQQTLVTDNVLSSVVQVENYLKLQLADEPDEWFGVIFLTSQHLLIRFDKLFRGTVSASYVHIRVIAREAFELNAAAVILAHNRPSGMAEPSSADQDITVSIKDALDVFDIKVLDHFIVSSGDTCSFANRGMM
jgi:DNA repair protein RadC